MNILLLILLYRLQIVTNIKYWLPIIANILQISGNLWINPRLPLVEVPPRSGNSWMNPNSICVVLVKKG